MSTNTKWYVSIVVVVAVLLLGGCYNGMNTARQNVNEAWANVQTNLQRRADLAKQVVAAVNAGTENELKFTKLLTDQAAVLGSGLRKDATGAPIPPATDVEAKALADKLASFNAVSAQFIAFGSANPQWKSVQLFQDYITISEGSENRLAVSRRDYNAAVKLFVLATTNFPSNFVSGPFGFRASEFAYFQADEASQQVPMPVFK